MPTLRALFAGLVTTCLVTASPQPAGGVFTDPFHGAHPQGIPGLVQCALFDLGGEGVAYHDTTPANEGSGVLNRQTSPHNHQRAHAGDYIWHFRENEGVDLSYVKDWADLNHPNRVSPPLNQTYIGWTDDGEWTRTTVRVDQPGRYRVSALYSSVASAVTRKPDGSPLVPLRFDVDGQPAATFDVPRHTEGWHHWDFAPLCEIHFPSAGLHQLTFHLRRGNNWAFWIFERIGDAPSPR
jgi:hypothetical protein